MKENGRTGQLIGPFKTNLELFDLIKAESKFEDFYIHHLGIQTDKTSVKVFINNKEIEIGKTQIYEIDNAEIYSIRFPQRMNKNTIVDYTIVKKEEKNNSEKEEEIDKEEIIKNEDKVSIPKKDSVMINNYFPFQDSLKR